MQLIRSDYNKSDGKVYFIDSRNSEYTQDRLDSNLFFVGILGGVGWAERDLIYLVK